MEDEIILEESKLSTKTKFLIFIIVFAAIIAAIVIFFKSFNFGVKKVITLEVGEKISLDVKDYLTNNPLNDKDYKLNLDSVKYDENNILTEVGEYTYRVTLNDTIKEGKIVVKDTKAPSLSLNELTIGVGEEVKPDDFVYKCEDYSLPCTYEFDGKVDSSKEGTITIKIKAKDAHNNETVTDAKLTIEQGASLNNLKSTDLKADYIEPDYGDWNKEFVISFSGAFDPNDEDNYRWDYYYEFLNSNYNDYLDSKYSNKTVKSAEVLAVYNKYHYIVGFAARATLNDGTITYLTNGE